MLLLFAQADNTLRRLTQAEAAVMGDIRKNMKSKAEAAAICCCCLLRYQADNTLRRLTLPLSSHYRSTPSKCKSARFKKTSEEIGVARGKK